MTTAELSRAHAATFALSLLLFCGACGGSKNKAERSGGAENAAANAAANDNAAAAKDTAALDEEIDGLEKEAEKNPADDDARDKLARAYVRRGNAMRDAQRMKEALLDYQRALRANPDNEEAQRNAAAVSPLVEGEQTGEYGEPAPLPITPNVTGDEEKATPTPKKP